MSGGGPRPEAEPALSLLLFVALLALALWGIWWFFRIPLLEVLRYARLVELGVLDLFTNQTACFDWLRKAPVNGTAPGPQITQLASACFGAVNLGALPPDQTLNYYDLTGYSINAIGRRVGYYLHWPLAVLFVGIGAYAIFISPRNKFKIRHTLESFIKIQSRMWPVITPIVNFKPADYSARIPGQEVPDKIPPFAEALSPEEWISWHRIAVTNGIPDRETTRRAFIQQLGPRWQGIENQPGHIRALFAAFSLKGAQKREEGDDFLGVLSTCWSLGGGFRMPAEVTGKVDQLIRDPAIGGEGSKIAARHAYRTTAMLGTLKWARSMGGVLAPAQFLWLRAADRALWYPLNNLGRRSFHTEGSGAMAHLMAEENAQKSLSIPRVDTAIVALNQFLADPEKRPTPIPPREEPEAES